MSAYNLRRCELETEWQDFLRDSPQACVYCESDVLSALGCSTERWFIDRNGYPAAAVPVITHNAAGDGLPMHSYYVGPMLHRESWDCKSNRRTENLLAIAEACMQELSTRYRRIEFCLHPDLTDIRGFDWFNYHTPELGRVTLAPRYTAECLLDADHIRHSARSSRRREERYALEREQLHFTTDGTPEELTALWQQSLARQSAPAGEQALQLTARFARAMQDSGRGIIAVTRDRNGGAVTAGLLLFDHHHRVHLPVVGTAPTRYGGTLLYFSMMDLAAERGYRVMDLNGANSPTRGYFKHSIGGEARLYFQLSWDRPT